MTTLIDTNRLVYDPVGRPGIPRECKFPARADWSILKMFAAPPPGWKAGDYKEYIKQNSTQGMVEDDRDDDSNEIIY